MPVTTAVETAIELTTCVVTTGFAGTTTGAFPTVLKVRIAPGHARNEWVSVRIDSVDATAMQGSVQGPTVRGRVYRLGWPGFTFSTEPGLQPYEGFDPESYMPRSGPAVDDPILVSR